MPELEFKRACVRGLFAELDERYTPGLWRLFERVIVKLGLDDCAALCAEVREIEENGGLWNEKYARRRTKGGVFIHLLRTRYRWASRGHKGPRGRQPPSPEYSALLAAQAEIDRLQHDGLPHAAAMEELKAAARIFEASRLRSIGAAPAGKTQPTSPAAPVPAVWEQRIEAVRESLGQKGTVTVTPTTKLMGRPGNVVDKGGYVVFSLEYKGAPSLPKGLPKPVSSVTYTVFMAMKPWRAVAAALAADATDQVLVEGFAFWDEELETHALLAQSATTRETRRKGRADAAKMDDVLATFLGEVPESESTLDVLQRIAAELRDRRIAAGLRERRIEAKFDAEIDCVLAGFLGEAGDENALDVLQRIAAELRQRRGTAKDVEVGQSRASLDGDVVRLARLVVDRPRGYQVLPIIGADPELPPEGYLFAETIAARWPIVLKGDVLDAAILSPADRAVKPRPAPPAPRPLEAGQCRANEAGEVVLVESVAPRVKLASIVGTVPPPSAEAAAVLERFPIVLAEAVQRKALFDPSLRLNVVAAERRRDPNDGREPKA